MPYKVTKVASGFEVSSPTKVHSKHTSRAKAEAQMRLLNGLKHGMKKRK